MVNKIVSFRLPEEFLEALEAHAKATGQSKTNVVVAALAEFYEHSHDLPQAPTLEQLQKQLNELREQIANLSEHVESYAIHRRYTNKMCNEVDSLAELSSGYPNSTLADHPG